MVSFIWGRRIRYERLRSDQAEEREHGRPEQGQQRGVCGGTMDELTGDIGLEPTMHDFLNGEGLGERGGDDGLT